MNLINENQLPHILKDYSFTEDLVERVRAMVREKEPLPKIIEFLMLEECEIRLLKEHIERIHKNMNYQKQKLGLEDVENTPGFIGFEQTNLFAKGEEFTVENTNTYEEKKQNEKIIQKTQQK